MQPIWSKQEQEELASFLHNNRVAEYLRANQQLPGGNNASEPRLLGQMEGWFACIETLEQLSTEPSKEKTKEDGVDDAPDLEKD